MVRICLKLAAGTVLCSFLSKLYIGDISFVLFGETWSDSDIASILSTIVAW